MVLITLKFVCGGETQYMPPWVKRFLITVSWIWNIWLSGEVWEERHHGFEPISLQFRGLLSSDLENENAGEGRSLNSVLWGGLHDLLVGFNGAMGSSWRMVLIMENLFLHFYCTIFYIFSHILWIYGQKERNILISGKIENILHVNLWKIRLVILQCSALL